MKRINAPDGANKCPCIIEYFDNGVNLCPKVLCHYTCKTCHDLGATGNNFFGYFEVKG